MPFSARICGPTLSHLCSQYVHSNILYIGRLRTSVDCILHSKLENVCHCDISAAFTGGCYAMAGARICQASAFNLKYIFKLIIKLYNRWLVSQGRTEEAVSILKKVEKVNGKHLAAETYKKFTDTCERLRQEDNNDNQSYSILDLFKTPRLRRTTILLIIIWMAISLVFDGHVRNVGSLKLNIFLTFTVASFTGKY